MRRLFIALIVVLVMVLVSCSESIHEHDGEYKAKLYLTDTYVPYGTSSERLIDSTVYIRWVDTLTDVGDIVRLPDGDGYSNTYRVIGY
jgi:hypothetical protein